MRVPEVDPASLPLTGSTGTKRPHTLLRLFVFLLFSVDIRVVGPYYRPDTWWCYGKTIRGGDTPSALSGSTGERERDKQRKIGVGAHVYRTDDSEYEPWATH